MNQKINGYILLTLFLLLFPSKSFHLELPITLNNKVRQNNDSSNENSFNSTDFIQYFQKNKQNKDQNLFKYISSYLSQLENNLFIYKIKIGSDEQAFKVILDTGSSILWIPGIGSEDNGMQISHYYNPNTSLTAIKTNCNYKVRYGSGYSLGDYYIDQVKLFNSTYNNFSFYMNFGVAKKTKFNVQGADGVLGLGRESALLNYSPLFCLKNSNIIENEGFSIKYNNELKNAILFFGDEHEDFKKKSVGFCPLASKTCKEKNFWSCELFSFGIINDKINSSINLNLSVIFDTGTNAIVLPRYILCFLNNQLKKIDCEINRLSLEISNIICLNKKTLPDLVFEIGNYYLTLSNKSFISYDQSAFNNTGAYILNVYFEEGIEMGVIGLPFFYEFHTRFDLDKNIMKFFSNDKKINKSHKRKINKKDINFKLKILIIILSFITLTLFIISIKYKYSCIKKESGKIEIISSDKIGLLPES